MRISRLMILLSLLTTLAMLVAACGPTRGGGRGDDDDDDSASDDDDATDDDDDATDDDDAASADVSGEYIWEYQFEPSGVEAGFYDCVVIREFANATQGGPGSSCSGCDEEWTVDLEANSGASTCDPDWFTDGFVDFTDVGAGVGSGSYWEWDGEVWDDRVDGSSSGSSFSGSSSWEELGDLDGDGSNDYNFRLIIDVDF